MSKVTSFINKATRNAVTTEMLEELKQFAADRGLNIQYAGGKYSEKTYMLKIELAVIAENSTGNVEQDTFEASCGLYGLKKTDYLRKIELDGKIFQLCGIKPNARKNAFMIRQVSTGKVFVTSHASLIAGWVA